MRETDGDDDANKHTHRLVRDCNDRTNEGRTYDKEEKKKKKIMDEENETNKKVYVKEE